MSEAIPRGGAQGAFFGPPPPPPLTDQLLLAWEQPPRLESDADLMDQAQKRQGAGAELMVRTLMSMTRNGGAPRPGTSAMASSADAAAISDISALLKSKVVKGIGPKLASSLISQFGARTLDVLRGNGDDEEQKRLLAIPGLGEKTLARIRESVATWESLRDGLRFCRTLGLLSESQVGALVSVHAERTEEVVRRNPYILLELFPRLRFGSVDVVARSEILGVLPDSPERARACIQHNLRRALNNGHCCVPQDRLLKAVARELAIETALRPAEAIKVAEKALVTLVNLGALVQEAPPPLPGSGSDDFLLDSAEPGSNRRSPPKRPFMLSLAPMHAAERHVAQAVRRRLAMPTTAEGGFDLTFGIYSGRLSDESERADDAAGCNDDYADEEAASGEGGGGGRLAGGVSFSASIFGGAGDEAAEAGEAALRGGEDGTIPDANLGVELGSDLASDLASELASAAQQPRSPPPSPRLPLSEMQRAAVERAALSKLMLLTGGPGTGKTYTVRAIVEQWTAQGKTVLLACPTARAANVLSESVGAPASTIHRLLEYNPREERYKRNAANPLEADCVVIDEASMLDVHLCGALFHALPPDCSILMVGDDDQLPSVGPGAVLHDLLRCPRVPRVALEGVFRQDPSGDIARNARLIQRGSMPAHFQRFDSADALGRAIAATSALQSQPTGCFFLGAASEAAAASAICDRILPWLRDAGYDLDSEVQVLSPMKRGNVGTYNLNSQLQALLNPNDDDAGEAQGGGARGGRGSGDAPTGLSGGYTGGSVAREVMPREGDRMIQLRNDYEQQVFNGDIGHVTRVWQEGRVTRFSVAFPARTLDGSGRGRKALANAGLRPRDLVVEYTRSALDRDVALSYALTVHKAQGAEYPVVVMPVVPQHSMMLYRNLLYTGLSRAKKLLVLVGSEAALHQAVQNGAATRRVTLLAERIDDRNFAPQTTRHLSD